MIAASVSVDEGVDRVDDQAGADREPENVAIHDPVLVPRGRRTQPAIICGLSARRVSHAVAEAIQPA